MSTIQIIYASTSGHTEYVVRVLEEFLRGQNVGCTLQRAEATKPEELLREDLLILASGTWNTGGIEGQMNPHMHDLLQDRAKGVNLAGKPVAIVALGDDRYFYTCRAGEHMRRFVLDHGGKILGDALLIVNEPYGQEERVKKWGGKIMKELPRKNA
ncbi:flavodoxin family protein [Candidatus Peribacteria bacterium]|nr:flavodoxin family protein [Candidatus Peribacteria bacterium]